MQRTRDWRRAQTQRVIAKRLDVVRNAFADMGYYHSLTERSHRLSKFNLNCGCTMCQSNKTKRNDDYSLDREFSSYYDTIDDDVYDEEFLREIGVID